MYYILNRYNYIFKFSASLIAVYLKTDDFLLLFFSIQYVGLFQQVFKPYIFVEPDKMFYIKDESTPKSPQRK